MLQCPELLPMQKERMESMEVECAICHEKLVFSRFFSSIISVFSDCWNQDTKKKQKIKKLKLK